MKIKRKIYYLLITPIYILGCIVYDKKYLKGKYFSRDHFTKGWSWILKYWFPQKVLGYAKEVPFPIPRGVKIANPKNVIFDPDEIVNFHSHGCYYQALNAKIFIGKGTLIAPNCGIITTNHDKDDIEKHTEGKEIIIGQHCWIGMNSIILPGVKLANHIIVGAGSVVTKTFEEENIIIAGNPAKKIKELGRKNK